MITPMHRLCESSRPADGVVAIDRSGPITWTDWLSDIAAVRARIEVHGGARWALFSTNTYDFSVALFALVTSGRTPWIPPTNSPGAIASLREHVDAWIGQFPETLGAIAIERAHDVVSPVGLALSSTDHIVLFTSGSTGAPKAIRKDLHQLDAEIACLESLWGERIGNAQILATVSHQHIYGLLFKLLWPLCAARVFHAETLPDPLALRSRLRERQPYVLVSSPALLKRMTKTLLDTLRATEIRAVFSSGGPLPFAAAQRFANATGQLPIEAYGSTETGGIGFRQQSTPDARWQTFPGVDIAQNEAGALSVRSAHLPDREWHLAGDFGEVLGDGGFRLGTRADRIAKIDEKRISLDLVEAAIARTPGVVECACIVLPRRRDLVAAVVALDEEGYRRLHEVGRSAYIGALRTRLREDLDAAALPRKWRFVDSLPVNALGKSPAEDIARLFDSPPAPYLPPARVGRVSESSIEIAFSVPAEAPVFAGHFPDAPVLPGAIQVVWAIRFAEIHFDLPDAWTGLEAIKFSAVIRPGQPIVLHLSHSEDRSKVAFRYVVEGRTCSSGRVVRA